MNRYELLRFEKGVTRIEVAAESGVPERTIRAIENGDSRPSAPTAKKLADYYEMPVAEFLGLPTEREAA